MNRSTLKHAAAILLPLVLTSLTVGLAMLDLTRRVSVGANAEDHERSRQTVISALHSAQEVTAKFASDNAYWDAAVRALYGEPDLEWLGLSRIVAKWQVFVG